MSLILVDDDPQIRRLLGSLLTHYGAPEVVEAATAEEALQHMLVRAPTGLTIDVELPGMGGVELARRIRAAPSFREVPILVVSASGDAQVVSDFATLGIHDYLRKPILPQNAGLRIQSFLARCRVYARSTGL
jgi:CheY-like chemotaxis protein